MYPVYFFGGLLSSGKTGVIKETLYSPQFNDGSRTLIIVLEEGIDSYDGRFLRYAHAEAVYFDSQDELTHEAMVKIDREYEFDQIFIEGNGMADETQLLARMPDNWEIAQTLCVVDASKFRLHVNNLKTFLYYHIKSAECIIFNRFDDQSDYSFIRNNVLGLNPRAELIFENSGGEIVDMKNAVVFDLDKDILDISDIDYGPWYIDASSNPAKYEGHIIKINVRFIDDLPQYPQAWIMGRKAMICCGDDIATLALTVIGIDKTKMDRTSFYELTGTIRVIGGEDGYDTCLLYVKKVASGRQLRDELVYFN